MKIRASIEEGKIAFITGGSSGIGLALACMLVEKGMDIWLVARRSDLLDEAIRKLETRRISDRQRIVAQSVDVADYQAVEQAISEASVALGIPDLVVNCAGVVHPGPVQDLTLEQFRWMMDINYFGAVHVIKAVLPGMQSRHSGYIVNVASLGGVYNIFGYTAYGASKYALTGFTDALRMEMKPYGIGVSVVFPPDTDTPQLAYENQYKSAETKAIAGSARMMSPEDVARHILQGISRGDYAILPGLEGKILYHLQGVLRSALNWYFDRVIHNVQRKQAI